MKCAIKSDLPATRLMPGRLRLQTQVRLTESQAGGIAEKLLAYPFVREAGASHITGSIVICYEAGFREKALAAASVLSVVDIVTENRPPDLGLEFRKGLYGRVLRHMLKRLLLPAWVRVLIDMWRSLRYLRRAAISLRERKLGVAVLDGAAISVSMLQGDFNAASSVMFLLGLSEFLEDYTRAKARNALAKSLVLNVDFVWVRRDGVDVQMPLDALCVGDLTVVRTGSVIPVDGTVVDGEAAVNQASLTGEAAAVFKRQGDSVFAGTLLEEGSLVIEARAVAAESRISRIVRMIDESDSLKANVQNRAERLADKIVPYNFLLASAVFAFGGARAAMSALLVDYSCAVKLATPIAVLSALREASANKLAIRGGKFIEAAAEADIVIFDKTGTLTAACPNVSYVGAFGSFTRDEVLKTAACIEEHFPHSLARAVVRRAKDEGLLHEENHADVEYIAAHGIATSYSGRRFIIGSRHFVSEDEGIAVTAEQDAQIEREAKGGAVLYLGADDALAGFICIADPIRPEAPEVIARLKSLGVKRIIMLTGDGELSARETAGSLGIDEYRAGFLPEDKREFVESLKGQGHKIMMVGDGINDSPALAVSDVSVAMRDAADLARETADVTLLGGDLRGLVTLRMLGQRLLQRVSRNFGYILGVNSALIALGLGGMLSSGTLALLHNASTVAVSAASTRLLLPENTRREK